jgi:hypothetical protein
LYNSFRRDRPTISQRRSWNIGSARMKKDDLGLSGLDPWIVGQRGIERPVAAAARRPKPLLLEPFDLSSTSVDGRWCGCHPALVHRRRDRPGGSPRWRTAVIRAAVEPGTLPVVSATRLRVSFPGVDGEAAAGRNAGRFSMIRSVYYDTSRPASCVNASTGSMLAQTTPERSLSALELTETLGPRVPPGNYAGLALVFHRCWSVAR